MSVDQSISVLVTVTLIEMMASIGMGVTFDDLAGVLRQGRLLCGALLANYVVVPLAAVALLLFYDSRPAVAAGFLTLAVCPGAPFGPPLAALAKSDVPVAVGLMTVLAATSALLSPLLLQWLLPVVAPGGMLRADGFQLVVTLLVTQLIPLGIGLALRHAWSSLALAWTSPANQLSKVLMLLSVGAILGTRYQELSQIRWQGYLGMSVLLAASAGAGWVLGGRGVALRRTVALTTAVRNIGVSLVIVTGSSTDKAAATAVVAYGLFGIMGSAVLGAFWRQGSPKQEPSGTFSSNDSAGMVREGKGVTTAPIAITEVRP